VGSAESTETKQKAPRPNKTKKDPPSKKRRWGTQKKADSEVGSYKEERYKERLEKGQEWAGDWSQRRTR
jgi:hypothetical protein